MRGDTPVCTYQDMPNINALRSLQLGSLPTVLGIVVLALLAPGRLAALVVFRVLFGGLRFLVFAHCVVVVVESSVFSFFLFTLLRWLGQGCLVVVISRSGLTSV